MCIMLSLNDFELMYGQRVKSLARNISSALEGASLEEASAALHHVTKAIGAQGEIVIAATVYSSAAIEKRLARFNDQLKADEG